MMLAVPIQASNLHSAMEVLSAMITPAVLILASGSLILTTSTRLIRCIDRVRELTPMMEEVAGAPHTPANDAKHDLLQNQLERAAARARLLQQALSRLYAGLAMFVATSVAIGVIAVFGLRYAWIALLLGFIGAGLLFIVSIMLIVESRIALAATYEEMDYVLKLDRRRR